MKVILWAITIFSAQVYLRGGYFANDNNDEHGFTRGFGIRLPFKDLIAIESNYAKYPTEWVSGEEQTWDFMLGFNVNKLLEFVIE